MSDGPLDPRSAWMNAHERGRVRRMSDRWNGSAETVIRTDSGLTGVAPQTTDTSQQNRVKDSVRQL